MTLTAISGMIGVHAGRPHSIKSGLRFLPNLVVITGIVLKRKLLQAFPVIITGLDRNDLK